MIVNPHRDSPRCQLAVGRRSALRMRARDLQQTKLYEAPMSGRMLKWRHLSVLSLTCWLSDNYMHCGATYLQVAPQWVRLYRDI